MNAPAEKIEIFQIGNPVIRAKAEPVRFCAGSA